MRMFDQGGDPVSQGSIQAVGAATIDTVVSTFSSLQGAVATLSLEQRRARQQEASNAIAQMAEQNPAMQLVAETASANVGDEFECIICQLPYEIDESITRLACRHHFHTVCIDTWHARQLNQIQEQQRRGVISPRPREPWCPCCRAQLEVESIHDDVVLFRLLLTSETEAAEVTRFRTTSDTSSSAAASSSVVVVGLQQHPPHQQQMLPQQQATLFPTWEILTSGIPAFLFHAATQIRGKISMIVDPGAWTSMLGSNLARTLV